MKCYLCGSTLADVIAKQEEIRFGCFASDKQIYQCRSCGLVQLYPQWTSEEMEELYRNYWAKKDFPGQKRKVKISKYLTKYIRRGDLILEVGCGYGDNLRYLWDKGYPVAGIDKSPTANANLTMDYKDWTAKVDVIYAIHLLEHLSDPRIFIEWLNTYSKKFMLEIPNVDDPLRTIYRNKAFQKFYWYPYHLFFYSKETIQKLIPGVKVILRQEYGIVNHLRWVFFGRPGNWNPNIPVLDWIYKLILTKVFGKSDTMVVVGNV